MTKETGIIMSGDIIKYLRHVGDDFAPEDETQVTSPECEGQGEVDEDGYGLCPNPKDCGICRYEYMKRKGWLK